MSLRAPRRRISPRTKRRYRVFRNFLRRALGTTSQPDGPKSSSNITVSVSELKQKIVSIEKQLNKVSQHCRDLITVNNVSTCEKPNKTKHNIDNCHSEDKNKPMIKPVEAKVLHEIKKNQSKIDVVSDLTSDVSNYYYVDVGKQNIRRTDKFNCHGDGPKKKIKNSNYEISNVNMKICDTNRLQNYKTNVSATLTPYAASYCSTVVITDKFLGPRETKRGRKCYAEPVVIKKYNKAKEYKNNCKHTVTPRKKIRKETKKLDDDFIHDIIRRQYRPVKLFSRSDAGLSQISVPLCRDQNFPVHENIQEVNELCSCCFDAPVVKDVTELNGGVNDFKRMYNYTQSYPRYRQSRNNQEYYNDNFYDLVPVKEKSSPKTRKQFHDCDVIPYDYYKEVPPSPRSLRPRLNLKAQYFDGLDDAGSYFSKSNENNWTAAVQRPDEDVQNNDVPNLVQSCEETLLKLPPVKNFQINKEDTCLKLPTFGLDDTKLADSLHNTKETSINVDKTDKTLYEIKDILQTFLTEIKKETIQNVKSEVIQKSSAKKLSMKHRENSKITLNTNCLQDYPQNLSEQCVANFINGFQNKCCHPILPVCPLNCVQNAFPSVMLPNQRYTCNTCNSDLKEIVPPDGLQTISNRNKNKNSPADETQQLIKEIYNCVKKAPLMKQNLYGFEEPDNDNEQLKPEPAPCKKFTSRSVGYSEIPSVQDVLIGTSHMKFHSKSCEALCYKNEEETLYSNASYSETVLENVSLEPAATQSSDLDFTSILDVKVKPRKKKAFSKFFKSFGHLLKKRKKDIIEELSESESRSIEEEDIKPPSPYRQNLMNYAMHGEEYFQQPAPMFPRPYLPRSPVFPPRHPTGIDSRNRYQNLPHKRNYNPYSPVMTDHGFRYSSQYLPTSPSYSTTFDRRFHPAQPQIPLCLKEIEVKSMGTQSDKKMSFLENLKKKLAGPKPLIDPVEEAKNNVMRMTKRPGMFNWKNYHEGAMQTNAANLNLTYKLTQEQLAETDMTIRNAMLKRFFYKRNPFSTRNPLLKTLLGKDKPMVEPPNLLRGRMLV